MKHKEISEITHIGIDVVRDINSCRRHKWLQNAVPELWESLLNKARNKMKQLQTT